MLVRQNKVFVTMLFASVSLVILLSSCTTKSLPELLVSAVESSREAAEERRRQYEREVFLEAKNEGTKAAYEQFIEENPNSRYVDDAQSEIATIAYEHAEEEGTVKAYEQFVEDYPESSEAEEARKSITEIRAEDAYKKAQDEDTVEAYVSVVNRYPDTEWAEQAREDAIALATRHAQEQQTAEPLRQLVDASEDSTLQESAKQQLVEFAYSQASRIGTIDALADFVQQYPESDQAEDAREQLETLRKERWRSSETYKNLYEQLPQEYWESVIQARRGVLDFGESSVADVFLAAPLSPDNPQPNMDVTAEYHSIAETTRGFTISLTTYGNDEKNRTFEFAFTVFGSDESERLTSYLRRIDVQMHDQGQYRTLTELGDKIFVLSLVDGIQQFD